MTDEDVLAIQRLKHESCFALDDGRSDEWAALFTGDGRFVRDDGTTSDGHEALREFASGFARTFAHSAHVVTNPVVRVDGNTASGRWYLLLFYRTTEGDVGTTQARYDDTYRRTDGTWLIAESALSYGLSREFEPDVGVRDTASKRDRCPNAENDRRERQTGVRQRSNLHHPRET